MRRMGFLFSAILTLLIIALPGTALAGEHHDGEHHDGRHHDGRCVDGTMAGGTYRNFTVTGTCVIAYGATVHIKGDLKIARHASLNDHGAELWMKAEMHVDGNIKVGRGGVLGLGWNSPGGEGTLGPDTVGGNITADHPLALQIGGVTVWGNVTSNGGGVLSTSIADFRNFPVKDNVIHGNLVIKGWHGGWIGLIRNTVDRNVIFSDNKSRSNDVTGPGTDTDSSEVMGTDLSSIGGPVIPQTIGGNLICHGNVPAAQVNPLDGGAKNIVGGKAIGQCKGLAQ